MTPLQDLLEKAVGTGNVPGAAAVVARGDEVEIGSAGDVEPDSIVRIASITKPITAAAVMLLVDEGSVAFDDPIARWLPELDSPRVVRTPESPLDDVVPAARPIAVEDVLTSRAGWGFPSDFSLPAVTELFEKLPVFGPQETPDEWLATLAKVPMLRHPGDAWLYNTCSDIQGTLIARVSGRPLPEFLAERVFGPLGMTDTGFHVPEGKLDRLPARHGSDVMPIDERLWREPPIFPSGAGGLVSTLADLHRFGRMLLAAGGGLLSRESVSLMMTDHLTQEQRDDSRLFLEGAGWGFGGAVAADGRYGWVGGTGTTAHVAPSTGTVGVLLTQLQMTGPTPTPLMREFWRYAFGAS
ncbi:MAG TPA: serine hydrolase domain-containing protein [Gaiellaceae bacterium]|jgi:CubicO group peptidase (beta-lactamase class C family)|nr:serine hydrolase domain-containing protein [Gaiellaceae bacterium]